MDYYNVDKILAEEEKLKVKFFYGIETFGFYINPGLAEIKAETRVEMPLFLVKFLVQNQHCQLVESTMKLHKNDLDAQASIVNLANKHFYTMHKSVENRNYLADVFYERMGSFVPLLVKNDFNEDDLARMSYEEKSIMMQARDKFMRYQNFYLNKTDDL